MLAMLCLNTVASSPSSFTSFVAPLSARATVPAATSTSIALRCRHCNHPATKRGTTTRHATRLFLSSDDDSPNVDLTTTGGDNNKAPKYLKIGSNTTATSTEIGSEMDEKEWKKLESIVGRPTPSFEEKMPLTTTATTIKEEKEPKVKAPSVTQIIKFAIPAVGIWLCSPLLSLIDTSAVGLLSGTSQQAALNPAISVTDYGGLLVAFMYTATTNLVAAAQGIDSNNVSDAKTGNYPRTTKTFITALQLALIVGLSFGSFLSLFGGTLLKNLMGNAATLDPAVFDAALRYVRIRALGMPAAVVIGTAQSACLGMQDVRSPLYVLIAAAIVNFIGDVLLVRVGHPWIGGAAGAAWATTISQYTALFLFVKWLQFKPRNNSLKRMMEEKEGGNTNQSSGQISVSAAAVSSGNITDATMDRVINYWEKNSRKEEIQNALNESAPKMRRLRWSESSLIQKLRSPSRGNVKTQNKIETKTKSFNRKEIKASPKSRGFLNGHFKESDLFQWSKMNASIAKEFKPFAIPVTISNVGRISGYIAMSHVASSALGTIDMAAQQIVLSLFCCLYPLVDALSHTAQSFVPTIFETRKSAGRTKALKKMYGNFVKAGGIFGISILGLVMSIPFLSRFFTTDLSVIAKVHGAIPGLMTFFSVGGLMCVGEGMLLGQKDLKFLGRMYGAYFFIVPYLMLRLKKRALLGIQDVGIGNMWALFSIYQCIRVVIWHARLKLLQRQTENETSSVSVKSG